LGYSGWKRRYSGSIGGVSGLRRWKVAFVRSGKKGLLYMLRPQYDRAMMEIEDEDNQMMSKGKKIAELEE
jgi:hypothetical protein